MTQFLSFEYFLLGLCELGKMKDKLILKFNY